MASGFSKEVFNTREEVVSQDLMRLQSLASRDVQNLAGSESRGFDCSNAGGIPASEADLLSASGGPISAVGQAPTLVFASGFGMTLGAGDGFLQSTSGVTVDDSSYQVLRWPSQTVTFTNPDGASPRIDVVYAQVGTQATDSAVRNILVDPNARTVAAQSVNKTVNPLATIGVKVGTPGATPVPPALDTPSTQMPLFYVWVPAAAPSAATFGPARATWRRAAYPFTGMSAVISGLGLKWDLTADPASTSASVACRGFHRVVIDGEVMEFFCNFDSTSTDAMFDQDATANPFGGAAPAAGHKPYYLYAVGGRNTRITCHNSFDGTHAPVRIVESTVAPDLATNRASANMSVNGLTVPPQATCYIGLGFIAKNTTRRLACIMGREMTIFGLSSDSISLTKAGGGSELIGAPANKPTVSTRARVAVIATTGDAAIKSFDVVADGGAGAVSPSWTGGFGGFVSGVFASGVYGGAWPVHNGEVTWQANANANLWVTGGVAGDTFNVRFFGYDHRVKGLGVFVNP